ncbi:hypothetical protein [Bradyrhizobium iriomotense]|uniref:hypothetical protein n=1 Tax=Bradyrhizobium iriomotense TaxID=441950 RepID=UPI0024E0D415|nr:hypothetical protein [Bradyrhizobium iriomotense]
MLLAGTERIVAIAFEVGVVADLFTDTVNSVMGLQPAFSLHRPKEGEHVEALDV